MGSSRFKIKPRRVKILRKSCPQCRGRMHGKAYDDGSKLYICTSCKFPIRVKS